jgi:hypothetical protein
LQFVPSLIAATREQMKLVRRNQGFKLQSMLTALHQVCKKLTGQHNGILDSRNTPRI